MSDIPPPPPSNHPPPSTPVGGSTPPPPPPGNMAPPPGYVAYGSAPTPVGNFSRIGGLSKAITIVIAIAAIGGVINAFVQTALQSRAVDFINGNLSRSEFDQTVRSSSAISAVLGIATIAGAVLVMIWMYRITANLRAAGTSTTWHPLFAVFGWILPPAILYIIPALMFREQWMKSQPPAQAGVTSSGSNENSALVVWWVFFGLVPTILFVVTAQSFLSGLGDTDSNAIAERLADTTALNNALGAAGSVIAAVAFVIFVRQLTARHRSLTGEN